MLYVIGILAVGFSAVTGALAAEGRRMDLFGVLVLALVTSLGGRWEAEHCATSC